MKKTLAAAMLMVLLGLSGCVRSQTAPGTTAIPTTTSLAGKLAGSPTITPQLSSDIEDSRSVMWIGPHPDDELFLGGTLGYLTRDLGFKGILVSFNSNPKFESSNDRSAEFLNHSDRIRIADRLGGLNVTCTEKDYACLVDDYVKLGVKDELAGILQEEKPDLVITFEPSPAKAKDIHAASATIAQMAIDESGIRCKHYYVLGTPDLLSADANMTGLNATDRIDLDAGLWGYRMNIIDIYSPFYPDLQKIINEVGYQSQLAHAEFFRKVR